MRDGRTFGCPYLGRPVELTAERERHILERHPELGPNLRRLVAATLADPDEVRRSRRAAAKLFSRAFDETLLGKHVVVVVMVGDDQRGRCWAITAYTTRRLAGGEVEWKRS